MTKPLYTVTLHYRLNPALAFDVRAEDEMIAIAIAKQMANAVGIGEYPVKAETELKEVNQSC